MLQLIALLSAGVAFAALPHWAKGLEESCRRALENDVHLRSRYLEWESRASVLESYSLATLLLRMPANHFASLPPTNGVRVLEAFKAYHERSEHIVVHGNIEGLLNLHLPIGSKYAVLGASFRQPSAVLSKHPVLLPVNLGPESTDANLSTNLRVNRGLLVSDRKTKQRYYIYPQSELPVLQQNLLSAWGIGRETLRDRKLLAQLRELGSLTEQRAWVLIYRRWAVITEKAFRILAEHRAISNPAHVFAIGHASLIQVLIEALKLENSGVLEIDNNFERRVEL